MSAARTLLLFAVALVAALGPASPARAHAVLTDSDPVDGTNLDVPPETVTFVFNEPVSAAAGGVRVFNAAGVRVDVGAGDADPRAEAVAAELGGDVDAGTYLAAYRVISADGHPVRGAIAFTVGEGQALDEGLIAELLGEGEGPWGALAGSGRAVGYATVLLAGGGVVFLARLHRGGSAAERARLVRLVRRTALVGVLVTVAGVPLQSALVSGLGAAGLVRGEALWTAVAGPFGVTGAGGRGGAPPKGRRPTISTSPPPR